MSTWDRQVAAARHGGPAFGHAAVNGHCCGMTLRQWYAGQALAAMTQLHPSYATGCDNVTAATRAFAIADAMLAFEAKGPS